MTSSINYFEKAYLTPIHGEPTFKTLYNLQSETKANANSVYSDPGGGSRGHLGLVITTLQYVLISPIIFVYQNHPGPLVIMYGTTAHTNSNMWIAHTKRVCLLREVTGVDQALVK